MADIGKELNGIKNAVYGREVRSSIHDGIKKINDEAENAAGLSESAKYQVENIQQQVNQLVIEGDSSVEAAQARVAPDGTTYQTLKERLDNTIVLSAVEPTIAEFWYEDKGESPINFNPGDGVAVANAVTSDSEPSDKNNLWFDPEEGS